MYHEGNEMLYINTNEILEKAVAILANQKMIGIDTEFIRRDTYYAKLSLIQISTLEEIYIIDPIKLDISSLKEILISQKIIKIFHAPLQDLGIFYNVLKTITLNVFDTQEAIKFLGIRSQISYQDACKKILNIEIEKEQQFREWNIRPLSEDMINYAAQDVDHLIPLYLELKKRMEEEKIFINFCRYMESFSQKEFYEVKLTEVWKKIRTHERSNIFMKNLQMIASFRETMAINLDLPRSFVISDQDLIEVTKLLPSNKNELQNLKIKTKLNSSQINALIDLCAGLKAQREER